MKAQTAEIALCHWAATADFEKFQAAAPLVPLETALEILLTNTSLLTPSQDLLFVERLVEGQGSTDVDLVELIPAQTSLHLLIDVPMPELEQRAVALMARVHSEARKYRFDPSTALSSKDTLFKFVQARTRRLDTHIAVDFSDPLYKLVENDDEFQHWWNTVLVPFRYYNSLGEPSALMTFEDLTESQKAVKIIESLVNQNSEYLEPPFVQFLRACDPQALVSIVNDSQPVNTVAELKLLNSVITLLYPQLPSKETALPLIIGLYESFPHTNTATLESIHKALQVVSEYHSTPELSALQNAVNAALAFPLKFSTLSELTNLTRDTQAQEDFYANLIDSLTPQSASLFISKISLLKPALFPNVPESSARKLVLSRFLSLRLYSEVDITEQDEELVIEHFWTCYKTATNGSKDRGELNAGLRALQKVSKPSKKIQDLITFVNAVDELFQYSLYFKRGTPLRPIDLLSIEDLTIVAQKILELNDDAYKSPLRLHKLLTKLSLILTATLPSLIDVECLCVDSSLVYDDFPFAFRHSMTLITKPKEQIESKWQTFFQVAKYVSPEWIDDETPESVIKDQMKLLSHLIAVGPISQAQIFVTQWKALDLELSIRDDEEEGEHVVAQPQRSLDQRLANALSSTASELLNDGNAKQVSNLLASGLGWAIGGRSQS